MTRPLPPWIQPGVKFHLFNAIWHVRGIVDDQAVLRRWSQAKRRWIYRVEDEVFFHVNRDDMRPD